MLTKEGLDFLLHITNYFNGHYEDPGWGQRPINQILVALSVHRWADGIEELDIRHQIQGIAEKAIANAAQRITESSS